MICKDRNAFDELQDAFSVKNEAAFFSERYGYKSADRLYAINKFGFFAPGLLFEILSWIKTNYGGLSNVAISQNCKKYINDYLTPLKDVIKERFEISNISEDTGRNDELKRLGKNPFMFRGYQ